MRRATQRGFTLVEVLLSLVILSVGLVTILRGFQTAAVALGDSRDTLLAVHLIRERLDLADAATAVGDRLEAEGAGAFDGDFAAYRWRHKATPLRAAGDREPADRSPNVKRVEFEIRREGSALAERAVTCVP